MVFKLGLICETFDLKLIWRLLPLLDQVSAAIDDLCFHQSLLVQLARSLYDLNQSFNQLHPQGARVRIDVLFLVHCQHLSDVGDEIKRLLVHNAIWKCLLSEKVLEL